MSFYDHVEKNALSFGRRAKDRVQAFTETTRLRSLLAGEEKYFHKLCTEIGEQYVRLHAEDYSPDFQELMSLATQSKDRAEGYRSQINALRKVRPCPNCGAEVPYEYAFCNFCGSELPKVEIPAPKGYVKCPGCGSVIPATMDFCNFCGTEQEAHRSKLPALPDRTDADVQEEDFVESAPEAPQSDIEDLFTETPEETAE